MINIPKFSFILIFLSFTTNFTIIASTFVAKLIPSHHYNYSNEGIDDCRADLRRSNGRLEKGPQLLVKFSMGTPSISRLAVMDTGSNLIWVQCGSCEGCVDTDTYWPERSSTYANVSCAHRNCLGNQNCTSPKTTCVILKSFSSGHYVSTYMATEEFTFDTINGGGEEVVTSLYFGCAYNINTIPFHDDDARTDGIFGLAHSASYSFVHRMGSKFSYCIGDLTNSKYPFHQLVVGEDAPMPGYETELLTDEGGHYIVSLREIYFGDAYIDIEPIIFESAGMMIDTGTASMWWPKYVLNIIKDEIKKVMDREFTPLPRKGDNLCYHGNLVKLVDKIPKLTLRFASDVDLVVDAKGFFRPYRLETFCLAMERSRRNDNLSVLGVLGQQNHNFGFDIEQKKLSIEKIDCLILDTYS